MPYYFSAIYQPLRLARRNCKKHILYQRFWQIFSVTDYVTISLARISHQQLNHFSQIQIFVLCRAKYLREDAFSPTITFVFDLFRQKWYFFAEFVENAFVIRSVEYSATNFSELKNVLQPYRRQWCADQAVIWNNLICLNFLASEWRLVPPG